MSRTMRRGAAGQQYAIIIGLIGVVALGAVSLLGRNISTLFAKTGNTLAVVSNSAISGGGGGASNAIEGLPYPFTSHTFTPCGASGTTGPALSTCQSSYGPSGWWQTPQFYDVQAGIQIWTVPKNGSYMVSARGAGNGASCQPTTATSTVTLAAGDRIKILVGQRGTGMGAGGGSFVTQIDNTPIAVGGGVGGGSSVGYCNANTGTTGRTADGGSSAAGGAGGQGGQGAASYGSGGGGLYSGGGQGGYVNDIAGAGFTGGGAGGTGYSVSGGFGGGAGGGQGGHYGGGGGYSGGGGSGNGGSGTGGGGGSYTIGGSVVLSSSGQAGQVVITAN